MAETTGRDSGHSVSNANHVAPRVVARIDVVLVLGFAICAALLFYMRWKGVTPFVFLTDDAGNIASFAAAWDHPELFDGDALLGNLDNIRFYSTVHVPIIRGLARVTGDYGTAFVCLLAPHVFLQALGFYVFGRVLTGHRFWAILFTVATLVTFKWKLDFWGLYVDPTPRISYQSLLPFLLAAAYHWRSRAGAWPWLLACAGVLMYVHPVSAPSWAFALWCGLIPFLPASWSLRKRAMWMFLIGVVFLVVAAPFLANYLTSHDHGETPDYDRVFAAMQYRFAKGFLDIPRALRDFFTASQGLWPVALGGAILTHVLRRKDLKSVLILDCWTLGLAIVAIVVPLVEHEIARSRREIPVEIDLIRNVRYLIPCMLVFVLLPLVDAGKRFNGRVVSKVPAVVGVALLLLWASSNSGEYVKRAATGQMKRQYRTGNQQEDWMKILTTIRESTPVGSRILPVGELDPLPIRYYAMRPVVHCRKDGGSLAYSNHARLLEWFDLEVQLSSAAELEGHAERLEAYSTIARDVNADYLLVRCDRAEPLDSASLAIVASTDSYRLLRVLGTGDARQEEHTR